MNKKVSMEGGEPVTSVTTSVPPSAEPWMGGDSPGCSMIQKTNWWCGAASGVTGLPLLPGHIHSRISHQPENIRICAVCCCPPLGFPTGAPSTESREYSAVPQRFLTGRQSFLAFLHDHGTRRINFLALFFCCFLIVNVFLSTRKLRSRYNYRNPSCP